MRATREEETSQRRFYLTIEWTSCSEICSMALINQSESIFYCIAHVDRQIKVLSVWSAVFRAIDLSALLSLFIFDQWFALKLVRNKIIVCRETCSRLSATARLQTTNSFTLILSWITESRQAAEHWRSDFSLRKNKHTRDILIIHDYSRLFFLSSLRARFGRSWITRRIPSIMTKFQCHRSLHWINAVDVLTSYARNSLKHSAHIIERLFPNAFNWALGKESSNVTCGLMWNNALGEKGALSIACAYVQPQPSLCCV